MSGKLECAGVIYTIELESSVASVGELTIHIDVTLGVRIQIRSTLNKLLGPQSMANLAT